MPLGLKYYRMIGDEIISRLVELTDPDGNIKFDENHLPDIKYYQGIDCTYSAERLKAIMLACHLEHQEGEDCLMPFIDEKISEKQLRRLLNKINRNFKDSAEDQEYIRKNVMTREGRLGWFQSLLRFRKRLDDLFDLAGLSGRETVAEMFQKAYSAITLCKQLSKTCIEYDNIMLLLLGDYAQQSFIFADEIADGVKYAPESTSNTTSNTTSNITPW